jgi:oxygen-independent coproporphyrinogen-3 oxidase
LDIERIRAYYAERASVQPGTKIQYGHPSPRWWRKAALTVEEVARHRVGERRLILYLHIPFCPPTDPPACGFCLFAREDFTGYRAVGRYLDLLERELAMYGRLLATRVDCVYFGGGTPNILRPADYARAVGLVRRHFELSEDVEITLEGVPQLFDSERLRAMAAAGITRVSVGAQQLKAERIAHSGRKQTAEQVLETVRGGHDLGMSVNVDLVCGWFDQEPDDLVDDLRLIVPLAPESIVIHPLTLAGASPFADRSPALPTAQETCETYNRGSAYLLENGYWASTYIDFLLGDPPRGPREPRYLRRYREIMEYDRLGVGYGANSLFAGRPEAPGLTWKNVSTYREYEERLSRGELPVDDLFAYEADDLRLLYVLKGLDGVPYLHADRYRALFGRDLEADFSAHWTVLREMGWLDGSAPGLYRLAGDGVFYTAMVGRCLSEERNRALREAAVSG